MMLVIRGLCLLMAWSWTGGVSFGPGGIIMMVTADETAQAEQEQPESSSSTEQQKQPEAPKEKEEKKEKDTPPAMKMDAPKRKLAEEFDDSGFDPKNVDDWGTYYDPQNVFCGKFDCYKILGFDYESYIGKAKPDKKLLTKRYRRLSREWHPDKSKHKDAKSKFVKISRAYEVLTNDETRKEYDFMRYDQEAYYQKYGTSILFSYAPKSDTTFVILLIVVLANVFSWYSQKHRWQLVADRLAKAAIEDWSTAQGGSPESKQLREEALAELAKREAFNAAADAINSSSHSTSNGTNGTTAADGTTTPGSSPQKSPSSGGKKQKGGKKIPGKEKKRLEQEAIEPIVKELVNDMHNFGGGFHQPTWRDLAIVSVVRFPYTLTLGLAWYSKYYARRIQGKELNDEEREVLTQRAVGPVLWDTKSDEERKEMIGKELWKTDNLAEWSEEQEIKNLSNAEQKYYNKMKRKGKLD